MNLGTQLKWFHDFWTSTQVVIIQQSSARKLNYKPLLNSLEKEETEFFGGARSHANAAQPRARGPCGAAQARGRPQARWL
jgi:hypothetical protein